MRPHTTRPTLLVAAALLLALLGGCQDTTGLEELPNGLPGGLVLPEPSTSLHPDSVVLGALLASACGVHRPDRLAGGEAAFVDIWFLDGEMRAEPTELSAEWVESHGGVVVHRFNVHAVRAAMHLDRIPEVAAREDVFVEVRSVPDPARYDVPVIVAFDGAITSYEPVRFIQLGGWIDWFAGSRLVGVLPDRSVPELRGLDGLRYVALAGTRCED